MTAFIIAIAALLWSLIGTIVLGFLVVNEDHPVNKFLDKHDVLASMVILALGPIAWIMLVWAMLEENK